MKALVFSPAFAPNMGSESLVACKLVLSLQKAGWEVDVISRRDGGLYSNDWEWPWTQLAARTHQLSPDQPMLVRRLRQRLSDAFAMGHPVAGVRWAAMALALGRKMISQKPYDVMFSRSPPEVGHLPALRLSAESKIPWIANWNDPPVGFWPSPYDDQNGSRVQRLLYRRLSQAVCRRATKNTFPSAELGAHFQTCLSLDGPDNLAIVPHAIYPMGATTHISTKEFRIRHAGKLCGARDPRIFLSGLSLFLSRERPAVGAFVVEQIGRTDNDLSILSKKYGIQDFIRSSGPVAYLSAMERLQDSDVNLLVEAPCEQGIFLPGKFTDYAEAQRPILAVSPTSGVVARLFREHGGGILADVTSPEAVSQAISAMYDAWKAGQLDARYQSKTLALAFTPDSIVSSYSKIVLDAMSKPSPQVM